MVRNLMASRKFCALTINLAIGFIQKPTGMHWLGYNDAVSWLAKTQYFSLQPIFKLLKLTCISSAYLPAHPLVRSPTRPPACRNGSKFTKMLFRRRFTHRTMAIPFILLSPYLFFFIPLARCESHLQR